MATFGQGMQTQVIDASVQTTGPLADTVFYTCPSNRFAIILNLSLEPGMILKKHYKVSGQPANTVVVSLGNTPVVRDYAFDLDKTGIAGDVSDFALGPGDFLTYATGSTGTRDSIVHIFEYG